MYKIVFIRHGQSLWNKKGLFTGWVDSEKQGQEILDVDLTPRGAKEAIEAGRLLKEKGYHFDLAYTSVLQRAIKTLDIVLDEMDLMWIPVIKSWKLNEKHYGNLQGLNKKETARKLGEEQVFAWRRGYRVRPPKIKPSNKYYTKKDPRYQNLDAKEIPLTESLHDVVLRVKPYWHNVISKQIKAGKKIIISAHGNSLRALVKYLDKIPDDEISSFNIPTGIPLVYELDKNLKPIKSYYLGDPKVIAKLKAEVKNQAKI
ncbi:MAG: 2,3-diphosphoglycerate-dependent phosphoglycerate mutase [Candidatus Pacebacteria bacterium]|nr:2,3-diphosphoglycerate-dependent phosphoglycerate mutase [Candidatus Paceibacterota bacterium]